MAEGLRPKEVAKLLWKLKGFEKPVAALEQWATPPEIAAEVAFLARPKGKRVLDLGAGTGILGIATILFGAERVFFVEKDRAAIKILEDNLAVLEIKDKAEIINASLPEESRKLPFADLVVMNPPFGSQKRHMDAVFLEIALEKAREVFALLSLYSRNFFEKKYRGVLLKAYNFPLPRTHWFHRKKKYVMKVGLFYFKSGA